MTGIAVFPVNLYVKRSLVPLSVLIVEDDPSLREVNARMLEAFGCNVEVAENTSDAWETLNRSDFDLCLIDASLGDGESGVDFYRELLIVRPDMRLIIVSGWSADELEIDTEIVEFLQKPFTVKELIDIIFGSRLNSRRSEYSGL